MVSRLSRCIVESRSCLSISWLARRSAPSHLTALALTRHEFAIHYLFGLIEDGSQAARQALLDSAPAESTLTRLRNLQQ